MRAYAIAHARTLDLPSTYEPLVDGFNTAARLIQHLRTSARPVLRRDNLLVLHGSTAQPAAIDLESKFAEAGLGAVQVADYRNFAHGRHNWISSRASSTSVLAFFSKDEEALARKTLSLLPKHVPVAAIALPAGRQSATIAGLISVLHVVGAVAAGKGVDPGRPHVASFGRRLYRMPVLKSKRVTQSHAEIAIGRKVACAPTTVGSRSDVEFWQAAYDRFCEILTQATFGALVCDYDGTLCDERDRFTALPPVMAASLTKVVQAGVSVGIATGRGKSVREALRTALPQKTWERIWVGYYNGADIALLANDDRPDTSRDPEETFGPICRLLKDHPVITRLAKCEFRPEQISIQPRSAASLESIWRLVVGLAETHRLKAFRSTHSIDLVNAGVSKNRLLIALAKMIPAEQRVLVIGDRGAWPGNDRELLRWPYSLCVDEVSGDPETCWNLAPSGCRGQSATIRYFRSFDFSGSTFRIRVRDLERNSQVEDR